MSDQHRVKKSFVLNPGDIVDRIVIYTYLKRKINTIGISKNEYMYIESLSSRGYPSLIGILRMGQIQGYLVWKNGFLVRSDPTI